MRRRSQQHPRNQAVTVKLSVPERAAVQAAAAQRHLSVGAYVADTVLAAAEGRTVPVHDTEREMLRELMPIAGELNACFGELYEAVARQDASGIADPDIKAVLARVTQSCDTTDDVMLKVARLLPRPHRARPRATREAGTSTDEDPDLC